MNSQLIIEDITGKLKQLPEEKLSQVAILVEELLETSSITDRKKEFIHSLKGKYKKILIPSDIFREEKQQEIDWEERNK